MNEPACPVYLFRSPVFATSGDTVISVAPLARVIAAYGGGGLFGEGGVSAAFGGAVIFRNEDSREYFVGVWGARKASRFRSRLRETSKISIVRDSPSARLMFFQTRSRPGRRAAREGSSLRGPGPVSA